MTQETDATGKALRRHTFTQLERTHFRYTRPADLWEKWMGASAHREIKRSACASVARLDYYGVFVSGARISPGACATVPSCFPVLVCGPF